VQQQTQGAQWAALLAQHTGARSDSDANSDLSHNVGFGARSARSPLEMLQDDEDGDMIPVTFPSRKQRNRAAPQLVTAQAAEHEAVTTAAAPTASQPSPQPSHSSASPALAALGAAEGPRTEAVAACACCGAELQFRRPTALGYLPRPLWHAAQAALTVIDALAVTDTVTDTSSARGESGPAPVTSSNVVCVPCE